MIDSNQLGSTHLASRRSPLGFGVALVGAIVLIALPARAAIINVPADQPTIQAGIDAAVNGDEVVVAPGTYAGGINFNGKAITVRSTDPTNPAVVGATIISGGAPVARCISGEGPNTVLSGFLITGGFASNGGGMLNDASSPTVTYCLFYLNFAFTNGGGMANMNGSNPAVSNCEFIENSVFNDNGSGGGMANLTGSNPTVSNCNFSGNDAPRAAGMYNQDSSPTVTDSTFLSNVANGGPDGFAGGMGNWNSHPTVTDCTFQGNGCSRDGGGMLNTDGSGGNVSNCTFTQNSASRGGGFAQSPGAQSVFNNCTFTGNQAVGTGGAVAVSGLTILINCTLSENTAFCGAAIANDPFSSLTLANCTVCGNTATGTCAPEEVQINGDPWADLGGNVIVQVCVPIVDTDGDGLPDENDVCPSNAPGLAVDSTGRPLRDCNNDCMFDGADVQCIVDEMLNQ